MNTLAKITEWLGSLNAVLLKWGRGLGFVALALMVLAILLQIFFRYVLNNALPWPEEAAQALMIWMMALVVPSAYRHAGFVAIDLFPDLLAELVAFMKALTGRSALDRPLGIPDTVPSGLPVDR